MNGLALVLFLFTSLQSADCTEQRHKLGALKTVLDHKLTGHRIILKGSTLLSCAQSCLAEPKCVSTNFGVSPSQKKPICELNDRGISLLSSDELEYAEGFVFSLYSETFQTDRAMKEASCSTKCQNGNKCDYDHNNRRYTCRCNGMHCDKSQGETTTASLTGSPTSTAVVTDTVAATTTTTALGGGATTTAAGEGTTTAPGGGGATATTASGGRGTTATTAASGRGGATTTTSAEGGASVTAAAGQGGGTSAATAAGGGGGATATTAIGGGVAYATTVGGGGVSPTTTQPAAASSSVIVSKTPALSFRFTTLGMQGSSGPISTAGYANTSLHGTVTLNKGIQIWTVPLTASYKLTVAGASGGDTMFKSGGHGAVVNGTVQLTKGTILHLLIGQKGLQGNPGAGGGGGTFVVFSDHTPLAIAGGGGGGGGYITAMDGDNGQTSRNGSVHGGANGLGGLVCANEVNNAGGGGGFQGDGKCDNQTCIHPSSCDQAGKSYLNGGLGGTGDGVGGFGGGGAASGYFPGGGGGYSGGGVLVSSFGGKGGGGGSYYTSELKPSNEVNTGDGYVVIATE